MSIKDPTIYPVTFSIGKRSPPVIENKTTSVNFFATGDRILKKAFYYYSGNYITDCDVYSNTYTNFAENGKRVSFEITTSSVDFLNAIISVKTWTSEKSFFVTNDMNCANIRQVAWPFANTSYSFYESIGLSRFNPVVVSEISYYPVVNATISFYPEYYTPEVVTSVSLVPGSSVQKNVITVGNYGALNILITTSFSWYYDKERTLQVVTPPVELSILSAPTFGSRTFFVTPGKFFNQGSVAVDGNAVFDGILTKEYVMSSESDYGSLSFFGMNTLTNALFVGKETEVIVDQNGYCAKSGFEGKIYFV